MGVEYIVAGGPQPELYGQKFADTNLARFGNPGANVWTLHAWVWKPNPTPDLGIFAPWNPRVSFELIRGRRPVSSDEDGAGLEAPAAVGRREEPAVPTPAAPSHNAGMAAAHAMELALDTLLERDAPLASLRAALARAAAGEGRLMLVAGEAGVGKTCSSPLRERPGGEVLWGGATRCSRRAAGPAPDLRPTRR